MTSNPLPWQRWTFPLPAPQLGRSRHLLTLSPNLCAFASLADVAKGGDGAKSALREIFLLPSWLLELHELLDDHLAPLDL